MKMSNNPVKYEVLIEQILRSIPDISKKLSQKIKFDWKPEYMSKYVRLMVKVALKNKIRSGNIFKVIFRLNNSLIAKKVFNVYFS